MPLLSFKILLSILQPQLLFQLPFLGLHTFSLLYLPLIFNLIFNPLSKLLFYLFNVIFLLGYKQSLALIGLIFLSHYGIFQN